MFKHNFMNIRFTKTIAILFFLTINNFCIAQIMVPIIIPEHGFLPGRKFPLYSITEKYDFNNERINVILFDDRDSLKLKKIECSDVEITNESEISSPQMIFKIREYIESLFSQSKIIIDSTSNKVLEIRLEAIDSRLIGIGSIKVHGLCQLKIKTDSFDKIYCTDIVDGDKNAPLKPTSFVTRKTASRFMTSAAIRETIEKILSDLK